MVHWDSSTIKQDDVSASSRISIEKITAGGTILLSASLRSEDDIMPFFEALCISLEEEGCNISDIVELHAHLNKTQEKWFLSKYIAFFAEGTPKLVMLPCDNNGMSLIRVAASHYIRRSKKKKSVKEGIKLMLIGSLLGLAIGAALLGGLYYLLLRYE